MDMVPGDAPFPAVHVNVSSQAGGYTVGSAAFFHYIVRLSESDVKLSGDDVETLSILAAIPHALYPDEEVMNAFGRGWRVVPPRDHLDWPVLEAMPQRLRSALERARSILWMRASELRISARDIAAIEDDFEALDGVISRAEAAGVPVNISYVS
jgi:hypothetical protein